MRTLLLLMLVATLSQSCRNFPDRERSITFEQCSPFFVYAANGSIDMVESVCFCRNYTRSLGYVGPVGGDKDQPIQYCNKLIGSPPASYEQDVVFIETLRYDLSVYPQRQKRLDQNAQN